MGDGVVVGGYGGLAPASEIGNKGWRLVDLRRLKTGASVAATIALSAPRRWCSSPGRTRSCISSAVIAGAHWPISSDTPAGGHCAGAAVVGNARDKAISSDNAGGSDNLRGKRWGSAAPFQVKSIHLSIAISPLKCGCRERYNCCPIRGGGGTVS